MTRPVHKVHKVHKLHNALIQHHPSTEETEAKARLADQFLGQAQQHFSEGRLNRHDEGDLSLAVAADMENKAVVIHFGKPVAWLGLGAAQTRLLAASLLEKAAQIDGGAK